MRFVAATLEKFRKIEPLRDQATYLGMQNAKSEEFSGFLASETTMENKRVKRCEPLIYVGYKYDASLLLRNAHSILLFLQSKSFYLIFQSIIMNGDTRACVCMYNTVRIHTQDDTCKT